MALIVLY